MRVSLPNSEHSLTIFPERRNVQPNSGSPKYTIPGLKLPSGEALQDSRAIASKLEELYPSPSLKLDSPILPEVHEAVLAVFTPLRPVLLPLVPINILSPVSADYFERTRAVRLGMPLAELAAKKGGDEAWQSAVEPITKLLTLIKGPYVLGDEVSYADFVIVGFLHFVRRVGGEERWEKIVHGDWDEDKKLEDMYERCKQWLTRDGH